MPPSLRRRKGCSDRCCCRAVAEYRLPDEVLDVGLGRAAKLSGSDLGADVGDIPSCPIVLLYVLGEAEDEPTW